MSKISSPKPNPSKPVNAWASATADRTAGAVMPFHATAKEISYTAGMKKAMTGKITSFTLTAKI